MDTTGTYLSNMYSDNFTGGLNGHEDTYIKLDHAYTIPLFPSYYFIIRSDLYSDAIEDQRVCLYQIGVVNFLLFGDNTPHDFLISNEPRSNRKLPTVVRDITVKVEAIAIIKIIKKY